MPRTPLAAGNWKMHKTVEETLMLLDELVKQTEDVREAEILVCPPFTSIHAASKRLQGTHIQLGAQNVYWEAEGAFTGEVSAGMLAGLCTYVIVGHSERRALFGETDLTVNLRAKAVLAAGLRPIVCVGETLDENEANRTADVVSRQVRAGLEGIDRQKARELVIAYEPVWAIGTGRAATPEGANDVIEVIIRPALEYLFDRESAQAIRVLYGGSMKPSNAASFFAQPGIDGGLVGGASLDAADFAAIVAAAV